TRAGDGEMGYPDRVLGRERGHTSADNFVDRGDCSGSDDARHYVMPCIRGWPYQMMNFDWEIGSGLAPGDWTSTELMAWGSPYGWLGASSFDGFDAPAAHDGRGDRSYATFIVMGAKIRFNPQNGALDQPGDVAETLQSVEALSNASI